MLRPQLGQGGIFFRKLRVKVVSHIFNTSKPILSLNTLKPIKQSPHQALQSIKACTSLFLTH